MGSLLKRKFQNSSKLFLHNQLKSARNQNNEIYLLSNPHLRKGFHGSPFEKGQVATFEDFEGIMDSQNGKGTLEVGLAAHLHEGHRFDHKII
jgi:hypothetical protein